MICGNLCWKASSRNEAARTDKDSLRISVLRLMKSALKNKEIENAGELSEAEANKVLLTQVKQRNEAIETYQKAGRSDLADKESSEKRIIESYLPEQMSEAEMSDIIDAVVSELGATSSKDMGAVMKESMARLQKSGKTVDGKAVNQVVRRRLSK